MIREVFTAGAVAASAFASTAQADVVYRWEQVTASTAFVGSTGPIFSSFGSITLTDDAADGRTTNYQFSSVAGNTPAPDPNSPVLAFNFSINGATSGNLGVSINPLQSRSGDSLQLTSVRDENGTLLGRISALNANDDRLLTLTPLGNGLSRVDYASNNVCAQVPGDATMQCGGATGRFARVPEPGILSLLALGAFGVAASMRRRKGY